MNRTGLPGNLRSATLADVAAKIPNAIVDGPFGSNLKLEDYTDSGVPVLQGKNITNDRFRWTEVRFISDEKARELRRSSVRVGDILMVKIGSIGYSAIIDDLNGCDFAIIPANLAKITPDLNVVDTKYLHQWLVSPGAKRFLIESASKTAQPALSLGKIKALPIPLPPLPEQRHIAGILDKAQTLRAKRRAALAKLDTLAESIFLGMFGDPLTNPKNWKLKTLSELGTIKTGCTPPSAKEGMFGGTIPFVTPGDLETESPIKRHVTDAGAAEVELARKGSSLVCCIGSVGKMSIAKELCAFNQQINAVEWNSGVDDLFGISVLKLFRSILILMGTSTTLPILKKSSFSRLTIPLPPLPLQQAFACRIEAIEALKERHRASLAKLDALFASLQHRAFRGAL